MNDPLDPLVVDGIVDEILGRLKTGKEAEIFLVRAMGKVLAAKVYKDRKMRSFKNDAAYKEGRSVRNSRTQRAMQKGSRFGREADEEAWKSKEAEALQKLFDAGVRVPIPHLFYEGVLLMELVLGPDGSPAPRLIDAPITREQAAPMYADLRQQITRILCSDLVHGDLSAYNVLLSASGPTIIDFPQVIGAAHNQQAEQFFRRDLEGIGTFFQGIDPAVRSAPGDAYEIWRAYTRRELTPEFVPTGRVEVPPKRNEPRQDQAAQRRPGQPSSPKPEQRPGNRHGDRPGGPDGQGGQPRGHGRHRGPGGQAGVPGPGGQSQRPQGPRTPSPQSPGRPGGHRGPPAAPKTIVTYVGQPQPSPARPVVPGAKSKHRRRRRRRGGAGGANGGSPGGAPHGGQPPA